MALDYRGDESSTPEPRPRNRERFRSETVTVLGNPWRKMSEVDLKSASRRLRAVNHASFDGQKGGDPWIKNSKLRPVTDTSRAASRGDVSPTCDAEQKRETAQFKRGKLERRSPVVCDSCGNESCECWRPRSPGCPRTPRVQRATSALLGAQCTCEPRSPRPSPSRLAPRPSPTPARALSDEEERPRPLYKSTSQRVICSTADGDSVKKTADPLLETTC